MLDVNQLSRKYGDFLAVNEVSFTIQKGEIVGLLGHNGAGKTTIMKVISGFLEANTGQVVLDGIDLQTEPKQVQKHLGYLPETIPVYPEMTVVDYLDFAADLKGLKRDEKTAELKRVIKATDISEKLLATISTLSRGYKQRVGVAQAILGSPKLLILDEPTNGLDPEQTRHMRDLIRDIAQNATVILSTHIMQEVEALCTRVLMLRGGKLALDAELKALRKSRHLLLEASLMENNLEIISSLEYVNSIEVLKKEEDSTSYRIQIDEDFDQKAIAANIAQVITDKGESLFALQPELRNLEALFKEINEESFEEEGFGNAA